MRGRKGGPLHRGEAGFYDHHRHWRPLTPLLQDEDRLLPETVPHDVIRHHAMDCRCSPCARFPEQRVLRKMKYDAVRASRRPRG